MTFEGLSITDILMVAIAAPNIFLPWIGVLKAALTRTDEYTVWPAISLYYILISFVMVILLSSLGIITFIKPIIGELLIYASTSVLSAVIAGAISEKVRRRFIEGLPRLNIQPKKVENIHVKTYASHRYYENSSIKYYGRRAEQGKQHTLSETMSSREASQERHTSQNAVIVDGQAIRDRGYIDYLKWCRENYRWHRRLTYDEFLKIKEAVSEKSSIRFLGGDSGIGIPELSILARISLREDLRNSTVWAEAIRKLNKLGLVSRNCKLMPRGVKVVKALKGVGLLEKIAEQTR
jgi:hypothetical protein